jgi:hypothetical protein
MFILYHNTSKQLKKISFVQLSLQI